MAVNPAKSQVMFFGTKVTVNKFLIKNISVTVDLVKLLGITIDNKLNFKSHTEELCRKVASKTKALFRIRSYITLKTARALYHAYILSTFKYCPLVWMNLVKGNYIHISKVHRRALCAVHSIFDLNLNQLLTLGNEISLHRYFIKTLLFKALWLKSGIYHGTYKIKWNTIFNIRPFEFIHFFQFNGYSFFKSELL